MLYAGPRQTGVLVDTYRYWKFTVTAVQTGTQVEINEITMLRGGINQIPVMTGPTTGGVTITADSYQGGLEPWEVGDGDAVDELKAWGSNAGTPESLYIDFGSPKAIDAYTITARNNANQYWPKDWTLYASKDDVVYVPVDARSGVVWVQGETKNFTI